MQNLVVYLNGQEYQAPRPEMTLAELLKSQGLSPEQRGVAAAVNSTLAPRGNWQEIALQPGDRVEIVRARQGG